MASAPTVTSHTQPTAEERPTRPSWMDIDWREHQRWLSIEGRQRDAVCEQLNIDAATFVGNSMGGFVSAEVAIAFPQRVERLVLVSAAGLSIEHQRNER